LLKAQSTGRNAVGWRSKSGDTPDKEPSFLVAYMPFDFGAQSVESDKREPSLAFLNRLAAKLRLPIAMLFVFQDQPIPGVQSNDVDKLKECFNLASERLTTRPTLLGLSSNLLRTNLGLSCADGTISATA